MTLTWNRIRLRLLKAKLKALTYVARALLYVLPPFVRGADRTIAKIEKRLEAERRWLCEFKRLQEEIKYVLRVKQELDAGTLDVEE